MFFERGKFPRGFLLLCKDDKNCSKMEIMKDFFSIGHPKKYIFYSNCNNKKLFSFIFFKKATKNSRKNMQKQKWLHRKMIQPLILYVGKSELDGLSLAIVLHLYASCLRIVCLSLVSADRDDDEGALLEHARERALAIGDGEGLLSLII